MPDSRDTILSRIREARALAGSPLLPPSPPNGGRDALPPAQAEPRARLSAFAEHMEKLGISFVLCDTRDEARIAFPEFARRAGWKSLAAHKGLLASDLLAGHSAPILWSGADCRLDQLATADAAVIEADAADAQFGTLLCAGSPGGLELVALTPTLIVIVPLERLRDTLDAALESVAARHGGTIPATLTLLTGPCINHTVERRAIPRGHGPQSITVFLVPNA